MFVYNTGTGYAMCASPLHKEYGLKKDDGTPYSKKELLEFGFFIDEIPDKPQNSQYEYVMKVNFETKMVYYDKIPIKTIVSEDTKIDYLTKELATNKLESMKLKGLLKKNAEEIAKAKIEIMKLKGGLQ
ncbi:hypothetical protein [Clostridium botulinum]|uniref:Uncharacterized protein n=1 Tax=Clostridium botulinum CFSAN001627 TaxID=1232189 RepID=M1ZT26_CLOBO|nr:hypothetical protein [Clostridium botulinum]EKN42952.1 hypothetical protein CFSAN001627_03505 [Clostridium botulinum CFSAN001627]APC82183.1 hypothetical protein NPD12_3795 [Clostridium botulinum]AXG97809.1 hypothetical protein AGE31_19665 [Clostridium botulinum]MBY6773641.1 hypothetical protein [Clostridium botulinum]MBY6850324.1 hypothetical protein [Clostridium botulinum]